MKQWLALLQNEFLKMHRTLAASMVLLGPASVVLLITLMAATRNASPQNWHMFTQGGIAIWSYLVFPLMVALQAAVVNGVDHRIDGWKRSFALPVSPGRFFLVKYFVLVVLMAAAVLVLTLGLYGVSELMGMLKSDWPATPEGGFAFIFKAFFAGLAGGLLMLAIHHGVSWMFSNFVFPIGLGIVGGMSVMQVASSKYWIFHPWTWGLMAAASGDPARGELAVVLGIVAGVTAILVMTPFARRLRRM